MMVAWAIQAIRDACDEHELRNTHFSRYSPFAEVAERDILLGEEFSDLEFFYTAMPDGLPFVPDEQPLRLPIKDEMPAIHVSRSRASRAPVKLQFDRPRRHSGITDLLNPRQSMR